jgi:4-amino-4-deoxychorismate lyase
VGVRYIIGPGSCIDTSDRGLAYGDGLFETMSLRRGRILRFELHLDRLLSGCERLGIPPPERAELEARLALAREGVDRGTVKLILTRGTGPRGYAPPAAPEPTAIVMVAETDRAAPSEIGVATLRLRLGENEDLAGIKHLCRLEQVLGQLELRGLDADEGVMLSTSGAVIGGTSRNLFAVFGDRVVTPAVSRAGIAGVMRRAVLDRCAALGIEAAETHLEPDDLCRADELFMTNALVGIQSVAHLDGRVIGHRAMAARLRAAVAGHDDV